MNIPNRLFLICILFHTFNLACSAKSSTSCLANSIANLRIAIPENANSNNSIAAPRSSNSSTSFTRLRATSIPIEIPEPNSASSYMRPISNNAPTMSTIIAMTFHDQNNDTDSLASSSSDSSSDNEMTQFRMSDDEKHPAVQNKKRKKNLSTQGSIVSGNNNAVNHSNPYLGMHFKKSNTK